MTDIYAEMEKKVNNLHSEIVSSIKSVLTDKGYGVGSHCYTAGNEVRFDIEFDRLLINYCHTDNIDVETLLRRLRAAMHVLPNIN